MESAVANGKYSRREFEARLRSDLKRIFGWRPWIVAGTIAQGSVGGALRICQAAERDPAGFVMALAGRVGIGAIDPDIELITLELPPADNMLADIHEVDYALRQLPAELQRGIENWDPGRRARVVLDFTMGAGMVGDRQTYGARRPAWAAADDKIAVLDIWHAAGVDSGDVAVVLLDDPADVMAAHERLAGSSGTVWAVDNDQGWHGGAIGTHWVQTAAAAAALAMELRQRHRRVRIMPFLEGVPCSIHGMVFDDATAAFRPCEMMVLKVPEQSQLVYGRAATYWDPKPAERQEMRRVALAVGDELRDRFGFRGVFTVDGVLTAQGFRPTEINPRFGAALPMTLLASDGEPISLLFAHLAVVEGELDAVTPPEVERWVIDRLDESREARGIFATPTAPEVERSAAVIRGDDGAFTCIDAEEGQSCTGEVVVANVDWGQPGLAVVRFTESLPVGEQVAPQLVGVLRAIDEHWGMGLPVLEPSGP